MRTWSLFLAAALSLSPASLFAVERWIPIAGTVGVFHTDVFILNPSATKDIDVTARFFPAGNVNNAGVAAGAGVPITIPRRQMRVLADVTTLFETTQLGAISFSSDDEFAANSRIYAATPAGTLGQSFAAELTAAATLDGAILQLRSTPAFRTNIGAVNVANAPATVTWRLHDRNNALVATVPMTMPPYGVISPVNVVALFGSSNSDLSDAWVSFTSTGPIFAYGSVVDNATTDPTAVPAQRDPGDTPAPLITTAGAFFGLNVADIDASTQWYAEKLGLKVVMQAPRSGQIPAVTVLEGGGLIVELVERTDAVAPGASPVRGFMKAGVIVDDFEKVLATLTARGVPIAFGPFPARSDQRANVIVRDNAGNLIQFFGQTSRR